MALKLVFVQFYFVCTCAHFFFFFFFLFVAALFRLGSEGGRNGSGAGKTWNRWVEIASKYLQSSKELGRSRARAVVSLFLHLAPAKQIFKDLWENFSTATSITGAGIGALKFPQWPTKGQSQISLSSHCGIIAESITFITSCYAVIKPWWLRRRGTS